MGRFIPVDPEKWAAMVIAQSDLVRYKEICDELDAECSRLKDENARLRSFCTRTIIPNIDLEKEVTRLKAEVERLTKAGDDMVDMVDWEVPYERRKKLEAAWNAAKEGKQP
jgi:hypothetical protein